VVRECFSRDRTLLAQSFERRRVQIIPLRGIAFVLPHIRNARCRLRAIKTSHVIPAHRIRGLVNCYWELMAMNTVGAGKDAAWQNKNHRWIRESPLAS
jgi:hypothetical protein